MAFSLKNLGQRLLDSTTIDEKASQFFRPKTGTLATAGRQWAQELAAKPAPSWVPQQVQQAAQNISDRGGFNRLRQEFQNPIQFTPLSMKSAAVDTGRSLGSEDLGYGLRGALSLTPFQSFGKLTPKLSAIQQTTAPTTSRQQTAQSIGQTAYGTALTAPLSAGKTVLRSVGNVARNLAVGGTTGALMQGGSDLLTGNFSKESLKQGALSGLQNSWVLPVTNAVTDAAILKLFPKAGLKVTGAGVTDPFKLGKIKEGFGRLLAQSLAQVPAENTAFTFLNQLDDKTKGSFTENWMNNLPGNIAGNILSAGVSGSVNVFSNPQSRKIVTDALKKTVDEWNTPVTMMGGEKMPMWKYKMMYETKPGFAALDLGLGKDKLSVEPTGKLDAQTLKEYESIKNSEYFSDNKNLAKSLLELENFKDTTTYKALDQLRKDRGIKDVYSEAVAKFTTPEALPTKQVDLKGFGENLDPKNKSRATILLSGKTRIDGGSEVITKAEKIEKLLGQGYKPETINGKPVLKNASGNFYEVTKIESDYAKHLSQSSPSKPLSVEPVGGKPDISNKVQQNIDSGMSVDEAVRKAQSETTTPIKNKSSKFTSAEEYARDEGVRAKAGIVSEKQRSDFFGSEGIPNGYNARSFYENRMRKAGFSEDQISKVLSRVEERPGTGAGAGMKSEDVADAMAEHNLSIRDQLRAEYNQSSPLGGKVGEAPTIKGIISQRPTGQVATQTPSELSLRQPSLPSQPNRPFLQTTQPQQPPQTPKLQMGSQKMPSTPEAQLDQWKYSSLDRLYTEGIDRFNPLSKVAKLAGRDKDMARQLARYYGTGSIADYHLTEELSPILKSVDINDLKKSAIAMRDVELASRGVKGSPEQVKAQANLQDLTNKLGQEKMTQLGESLKKLYAYQDSMVKKYLVDTGIMSQDSYNAMRKNNQFYVPFKRVMDDVDEMLGVPVKRGAGSVGKQNVIFGIKGSDKEIVDPIESIVENTYKLVSLGERQKTAKVIASLGEQLPGLIKKVATGDSKNTVGLFENGKKVFYEVPVEVADAARGMSEESLNTLIKILKLPTDVFRTMTTGANPEFLLPNVSRDLQTAWFNAGVNPIEWIAGIAHYVKGDQVYKDFLRSGGRTSIISANKEAITRTAQDLATNKGFSIKSPKDLWKGFEILGQFSEQPTRIASFKKIYDKAIKSGLSPEEALQDAAIAAQDTTINFARRGSKTQSINAVYAYLNARMQGVDKMLRTIKNEPGKAAARFGIGLLAPSLALYAWNNRFQSYYDPSVVSDRDKTDNFIFMLSDKRGGMQYLKIPKAEVGKIVNPVEEFLDFARGKDANMANSIKSLLTSFLPIDYIGGLVPTAIQPPLENAINKDLYTGYDLVPQYKKNYPKGYQDSPYTSPVYRMIGQKTGQSPAKLQNLVEGYLGGMSKGAEMITRPLIPQKYVSPKNEQGADINKTFILRRFAGGEKKSAADQAKANQAKNESLQTQINTITKQKLLGNFDSDVADKEIAKLEKQMATDKSIETKTNSNYYQFINNSGDLETIDIRQPIAEPKLTGQTEIDKKLKSSYKGKITSRINDIVKLVDAGQLDAKKAESMIKELQVKSAKMSGGKKPKVINIKVSKRPSVKFKLGAARPTLKISAPTTKKSRLSLRNYKVGKIRV